MKLTFIDGVAYGKIENERDLEVVQRIASGTVRAALIKEKRKPYNTDKALRNCPICNRVCRGLAGYHKHYAVCKANHLKAGIPGLE